MHSKQRLELRLDVSGSVPFHGPIEIAATVFLPSPELVAEARVAIFAIPGGGYSREYFDLRFSNPALTGYSQAEYHLSRGQIFIACDPIGVGDSSIPDLGAITFEHLAQSYSHAVRQLVERLVNGTLTAGYPAQPLSAVIGIGQSLGGCITLITQARHGTFDGIAPLGYSGLHTVLPQRTWADRQASIDAHTHGRDTDPARLSLTESSSHIADFLYPFHWEDVPREIIDADLAGGYPIRKTAPPFGSRTIPNCALLAMSSGFVTQEASSITVPVLVGVGERDVCPDPHAEPSAYRGSRDVALFIVPGMAHMHNFASSRRQLWQRIGDWSTRVASAKVSAHRRAGA